MFKYFKKIFNRSEEDQETLTLNSEAAHDIKNSISKDLLKVRTKVQRTQKRHMKDLDDIQLEMDRMSRNIAKHIAVATGGRTRGYHE